MKIKKILIAVLIFIPVAIIAPWFIFPVLNDIKAKNLADELRLADLPDRTEIVEVIFGCGNTGGTGNHTEIWANALIKTELSEEEIYNFYDIDEVTKVGRKENATFSRRAQGENLLDLKNIQELDGYYIIEWIDSAVSSQFDLRGH